MVSLEELALDLVVIGGHGSSDLKQVDMRDVVILLPSKVLLPEVSCQLRCDQLEILLALTIGLLASQQPPLRLYEVHHEALEGLIENISEVLGGHSQFGLQGDDLMP